MEGFHWVILASVAVPLIWAISSAVTTAEARNKFANMGVITGKTKGEIYLTVGPPNSISSLGEGKELLQWSIPGYHIALIFTNDICDGVSHEHSA